MITALTGLGTLMVWVIYLQVFISSYRRQLRATLLITRGAGQGLEARCFLSNMSSESIYVQSVLVALWAPEKSMAFPVTDILGLDNEAPADPWKRTRQGPLGSGETRDIGSFGNLIEQGLRALQTDSREGIAPMAIQRLTIEVVGLYGSEDLPVGARRRFLVLEENGRPRIQAKGIQTQQIRGRRERKKLESRLARDR
ncbi:hypothetical protein [Pseudaminobacter soli (ex Zhang et al. 2022)]|uniref:hypothetical protein n=1 Tax=Pseudaminobacter soli (ex Zhang et al. 2022) TaxID=2831468 RepID=UPI0030804239